MGAILEKHADVIPVRIRNNQSARAAVDVAEFLAGLGNDRSVNDGEHLLDMVEKQTVKKNFVGVLKLAEINVALEIVGFAKIGFVGTGGLFFDGFDDRREEAVETEGLALRESECRAFV
jgi:hypothetical protein